MKISLRVKERVFEPGLFGQSHASTLVRLKDGRYLSAWFAGTKEGADDVGIYGAPRSRDGGWGNPACWAKIANSPHWNPVLAETPGGSLWLFFKVGDSCDRWRTWFQESSDGGSSWSSPHELVPGDVSGGRGPVKNKPIALSDNSWLAPASREDNDKWRVFADRSTNGGATWTTSPEPAIDRSVITGKGVIQPTLWESAPGKIHMLMRSSCSFICRSDSADSGRTWSEIRTTSLPNNNSGIDLVKASDGTLLLCYNKVGKDWGPRTPLNLASSNDNGESWQDLLELETAPGEYSYPAIISTPEGFAGTYTWKRDSIVFWEGCISRN